MTHTRSESLSENYFSHTVVTFHPEDSNPVFSVTPKEKRLTNETPFGRRYNTPASLLGYLSVYTSLRFQRMVVSTLHVVEPSSKGTGSVRESTDVGTL